MATNANAESVEVSEHIVPRRKLSDRQERILEAIARFTEARGRPPRINELGIYGTWHSEKVGYGIESLQQMIAKGFIRVIEGEWAELVGDNHGGNLILVTRLRAALAKYGKHARTCAVTRHSHQVECDCGLDEAKLL